MRNDYEMITVVDYLDTVENVKCLSASEQEIQAQVEKYLLSVKRSENNAKIVEALLA